MIVDHIRLGICGLYYKRVMALALARVVSYARRGILQIVASLTIVIYVFIVHAIGYLNDARKH
jgi:hypothetical protein